MNGLYRYYLDEKPYADPINWEKWEETLRRDASLKGMFLTVDLSLEFTGKAYLYLNSKFQNFDSQTILRVEEKEVGSDNYNEVYSGIIFTTDIEFTWHECKAKTKVQDNSYYAKIFNNKSLEAIINIPRSKNNHGIFAANTFDIQLFDPCTGAYAIDFTPKAWSVNDAIKFIVAFMSDGEVGFDSPVFGAGGAWEHLMITKGIFLHSYDAPSTAQAPKVSFIQLLKEINSKDDFSYYIDNNNYPTPTLVIDYTASLYNEAQGKTFSNVKDIVTSYDVDKIYSSFSVGTTDILEKGDADCSESAFYDESDWITVKQETYTVLGKSNIDRDFNIQGNFIVSSNLIQSCYFNDDQTNDDKIFFLHCKYLNATQMQAIGTSFNNVEPYFYNRGLFNDQVAKRYFRGLPSSIASYTSDGANGFKAVFNAGSQTIVNNIDEALCNKMLFNDDYLSGYDANNNWGNGTTQGSPIMLADSIYIAPISGYLLFKIRLYCSDTFGYAKFKFNNPTSFTASSLTTVFSSNGSYYEAFVSGYAYAGDHLTFQFQKQAQVLTVMPTFPYGSSVELVSVTNSIVQFYDPTEYLAKKTTFEPVMNTNEYNKLLKDRFNKITASNNFGNSFTGWLDSVKFNRITSKAKIQLISNQRL